MHQLYVYSSTGNTLHAAERMASGLGDGEIVNMARRIGAPEQARGDTVGICYPVHAFGAPTVVHRFLETFSAPPGSWVYLLLTSGGGPLGAAAQGKALLARRGVVLRGAFHVTMPGNYPPLANPPAGEKLRKKVLRADDALDRVLTAVRDRRGPLPFWPLLGWISEKSNTSAMASVGPWDQRLFATDACTACGICAAVCPVGDVTPGSDGRPRWQGRCTGCMACFHWCPTRAIQYNTTNSPERNRYHHPAVSPDRFLAFSRA